MQQSRACWTAAARPGRSPCSQAGVHLERQRSRLPGLGQKLTDVLCCADHMPPPAVDRPCHAAGCPCCARLRAWQACAGLSATPPRAGPGRAARSGPAGDGCCCWQGAHTALACGVWPVSCPCTAAGHARARCVQHQGLQVRCMHSTPAALSGYALSPSTQDRPDAACVEPFSCNARCRPGQGYSACAGAALPGGPHQCGSAGRRRPAGALLWPGRQHGVRHKRLWSAEHLIARQRHQRCSRSTSCGHPGAGSCRRRNCACQVICCCACLAWPWSG